MKLIEHIREIITLAVPLILTIAAGSCDEKIEIDPIDNLTTEERLMVNDWQYQYVYIDSDTMVIWEGVNVSQNHIVRNFAEIGEPVIDTERTGDIRRSYLRYKADNSYELKTNNGFWNMGYEEDSISNYQPNYGYWDIEIDGDSTVLMHNKLMIYEKRYLITTLTEDSLVRRLMGPRYVFYFSENATIYTLFKAHTWIEVFTKKSN